MVDKYIQKSLESFFGVGSNISARLMARHHIHPFAKVGELANKQVLDLTAALSNMKIENDLRRQILDDIKRLRDTGTYRGRRHALSLPVRGQNTRSQVGFYSNSISTCFYLSLKQKANANFLIKIKTAIKLNRVERRL
jgi:small subunit ribosomal protein S13